MGFPDPRVTAFAYRRQALDGSAATAMAAVAAAVGVYAVNPTGPLSIRARAPSATADDVLALERAGLVMRGRAMRTSAFLVPAATAPLVAAATAQPIERFAWMLRAAGIPPDGFEAARDAILAAAAEPRTTRELRAVAAPDGVDVKWLVSYLALRGDLAALGADTVTSNVNRYVARRRSPDGGVDTKAGAGPGAIVDPESTVDPRATVDPESTVDPRATVDPERARAWLAGAYLRAFGPARAEDFAWWSGLPSGAAAAAIAAHRTADVGGGLLLLALDLPAFEAAEPLRGELALAPKWDAWTMGYPVEGRDRFVDIRLHDRLFDGDGNGLGAVLVDGRAVGAWIHRGVRGAMEVDLDLFERPSARLQADIEARLGSYAGFLGYRSVRVRAVPTVVPDRPRVRRPLG